jgi:hypothetical protein
VLSHVFSPDNLDWPFRSIRFVSFPFDFWAHLKFDDEAGLSVQDRAAKWDGAFAPGAHVCVVPTVGQRLLELLTRYDGKWVATDDEKWERYRKSRYEEASMYLHEFCRLDTIGTLTIHDIQCGEMVAVHQSAHTIIEIEPFDKPDPDDVSNWSAEMFHTYMVEVRSARRVTVMALAMSMSDLSADFSGSITFRHYDRLFHDDIKNRNPRRFALSQHRNLFWNYLMTEWEILKDDIEPPPFELDIERLRKLDSDGQIIFECDVDRGASRRCPCCFRTNVERGEYP